MRPSVPLRAVRSRQLTFASSRSQLALLLLPTRTRRPLRRPARFQRLPSRSRSPSSLQARRSRRQSRRASRRSSLSQRRSPTKSSKTSLPLLVRCSRSPRFSRVLTMLVARCSEAHLHRRMEVQAVHRQGFGRVQERGGPRRLLRQDSCVLLPGLQRCAQLTERFDDRLVRPECA